MTSLEAAVVEVASVLESLPLPYMLIGGLAVSLWGEPRATLDVDVTIWVEPQHFEQIATDLCGRFRPALPDPVALARRTRVLPVQTSQGVRVDIIFAALSAEKQAIDRAQLKQIAGKSIMVAAVEDLILMKLISERQKDLDDARRLLRRYRRELDRTYLKPRLAELAEALHRPEILKIFEDEQDL